MLEDSPRMLQNEIEKSLGATVVAAVEVLLVLSRFMEEVDSKVWLDSQNDRNSGNLKAFESSHSYPVASEGPPGAAS